MIEPFSIEELETGLRKLGRGNGDLKSFWDENIIPFRQTVLFAIHETSEALLSPSLALRSRVELEGQLETLTQYLKLADHYVARQVFRLDGVRRHRMPAPLRAH